MRPTQKSSGFTIVELVIAIPVILIVMGVIMGFLITLLNDLSTQRVKQSVSIAGVSAVQQIESDIKLSSAFLKGVDSSSYTDYYGPSAVSITSSPANKSSLWKHNGEAANTAAPYVRTLILYTYATTANPLADTRSPVYIDGSSDGSACSGMYLYANQVLRNTVIYFVRDGSLFRRVLTIPDSVTKRCGGASASFQVQSCPVTQTTKASNCVVDDTELLRNVSEFSVDYLASSITRDPITTAYSSTSSTILEGAMAVKITIKHKLDESPQVNSISTIVTRLN
jgi:type II secretory pathway pseudopilin PulG